MPDFQSMHDKLAAEQQKFGHHYTKAQLDAELEEAGAREAAIDQHRSELAGQEVKFAKAIAAEQKGHAEDQAAPENGKTKADIDADLFAAAERKRAIDEAKSAKAGQDYKHVMEVVESKRRSVEALQSEKNELDAKLAAMNAKEQEITSKIRQKLDQDGRVAADGPVIAGASGGRLSESDKPESSGTGSTVNDGGVVAAATGVLESVKSAVGLGGAAPSATHDRSIV